MINSTDRTEWRAGWAGVAVGALAVIGYFVYAYLLS